MVKAVETLVPEPVVVDAAIRRRAAAHARERGVRLPTFAQLSGAAAVPAEILKRLAGVDPDAPSPENLWRIHWFNAPDRVERIATPDHLVLPTSLTGVAAPIVVLLGSRFPMIGAHKVLPAYAGLVTRLVSGTFDPARQRAVWPSTGNYCRGGIAVSRILGCDGVAVLPEGMSRERFDWLARWVGDPANIVRTVGTESNVKEIYDKCHELEAQGDNVILNQFSAFSNYMAHRVCTGAAAADVFESHRAGSPDARLAAFVSATGSAGTIAAGDRLKAEYGTRIAAVEALECPTMLENGYGAHNIQGIGDKHVPIIQNVMNSDFVIGVSDRTTDQLNLLFNTDEGRAFLRAGGLDERLVEGFAEVGLSGLANIVASIKLARAMDYGEDDVVLTVATDSARLYVTEMLSARERFLGAEDAVIDPALIRATCLDALTAEHVLELRQADRRRVFNLGYYTWVEQQGVPVEEFDRRKEQSFWDGVAASIDAWDALIDEFNAEAGARPEPAAGRVKGGANA
jgi:cysteine synthase A